jgi:hypothetical protein
MEHSQSFRLPRDRSVDNDQVLLVLLAVRMQGGQAPATGDLLKPLKAGVKLARDKGLLTESTVKLPSTTKAGKTTMKNTAVLALSEQGENFLRQHASPEALNATASGQLQALQKSLESDRLALREEVLKAVSAKGGKAKTDLGKELTGLAQTVTDLGKRLEKVEAAMKNQGQEGLAEKIDQAFASLQKRLEKPISLPTAQSMPISSQPVKVPGKSADWSEEVIRMVMEQKQRNSFQRLTLPQIFDQLRTRHPDMTLGQFHDGLRRLQDERRLRLGPYTQALATLDDPRNALFLDREVKFYVELP